MYSGIYIPLKKGKKDLEKNTLNQGLASANKYPLATNANQTAAEPSGLDTAANNNLEQPIKAISFLHDDPQKYIENKEHETLSSYLKKTIGTPVVQLINLDLNFAKVGSMMMMARLLISPFIKPSTEPGDKVKNPLDILDDFLLKIRQVCQYSIHARPSHISRTPDDISSDSVHNLEAVSLGTKVYNLNAFIAPWLVPIKWFLPHSSNRLIGTPSRLIHCADQVIGKITNLFWNLRRVSMSLIPYNGGIKTDELVNKQNSVRDLIGYFNNYIFIKPIKSLINYVDPQKQFEYSNQDERFENIKFEDIVELSKEALSTFVKNTYALIFGTYEQRQPDGNILQKKVGSEEADNNPIYVRSKILSQLLGLPAGFIGGFANLSSIGLNVVGNIFDIKSVIKASDNLTNFANSLMAMVYMTGEVPANINEFFKKKNIKGITDYRHLIASGIGALGMMNRIKFAPIAGSLLDKIGVKSLLDRFDSQLEKCFLGFFSYNRWLLHEYEKKEAQEIASPEELELSRKHDNFYKQITLPLRVILGDSQVSYRGDHDLTEGRYEFA